eukprot:5828947-Amphidinium_carterae.1
MCACVWAHILGESPRFVGHLPSEVILALLVQGVEQTNMRIVREEVPVYEKRRGVEYTDE